MATGISLSIGLNSVDPAHYDGWEGKLAACEADAKDMVAIAKKRGFVKTDILLTQKATAEAVTKAILAAAKQLVKGDMFLLTYSGHGGQVPDKNLDEMDRMDETWLLYDRQLVDDEMYQLYSKFKSGVRVLVLSDSCHSGSVTRAMPRREITLPAVRAMPRDVGDRTYEKNKTTYDKIQLDTPSAETAKVKAAVLLISGCQDNQLSSDGDRNGLFTGTMQSVWNQGKFKYGYRRFRDTIVAQMPPIQTPNYFVIGTVNPDFENQIPFTL